MAETPAFAVAAPNATLNLLLVEDNPSDVELCLRELKRAGLVFQADVVQTAADFMACIRAKPYDLVITDYRLPSWTGLDALSFLKELGIDIPLILMTGTLGEEKAVECIKLGVTDYLLKGALTRLPLAIRRALEEKTTREERARAEQKLADSERRLRTIIETEPECVNVLSFDGTVLEINSAGLQMMEADAPDQVVGKSYLSRVAPEYQKQFRAMLEHAAEGHENGLEFELKGFKGTTRWMEARATPLRNERDEIHAILTITHDSTGRKLAEEMLRESEARYRGMFENATYGIYRTTIEGELLDANPAFVNMLGYRSRAELLSVKQTAELFANPRERARLVEQYERTSRVDIQVEWKRKDGRPITVRLNGRKVQNHTHQAQCLEIMAEDVSERLTLEKQLQQAQKFEAIGQLAGGIAHDFNNMIGAILGWAELGSEETSPDSRVHSHFQKVRQQAERAAALTRQLLAFARRQILEPRNIDLNQAVREVLSLLEKVIGGDIELETRLAPDLAVVRADPTQVEQVLMNLCLNARDAMPQGGRLRIETANVESDAESTRQLVCAHSGPFICLTVSDTGVGMDAATLDRIFEPFFTTKGTGKGTGLGLATVYGIVKQHNGFVHVTSELGLGSSFYVYLPVSQSPVDAVSGVDAEQVVLGGTETILVAEDHEGLREIARETLARLGYRVMLAVDGEEAVQKFQACRDEVALVLLDVVLPKLSGPRAYVRMCQEKAGVPVIFATGYSADAAMLAAVQNGDFPLLQKPYSPRDLARRVREVLDEHEKDLKPSDGRARTKR
jgi:two-component system cell cycle sensor histidine kinase/response regulator CckA